ncbi:MAG: nitroreductase/quinone reductase family protein [Actinomycetota bacterium]
MATITRSTPSPWMMRILNPAMQAAITRGWGSVGDRLMVLHWTGRKTGKAYSTPVGRHVIDGQLFTITQAGYKHNFVGGGPAELVLDGERQPFTATVVDDPEVVGRRMRTLLDELGPKHGARSFGSKVDGDPTLAELVEYAAEHGAVTLDFEPA